MPSRRNFLTNLFTVGRNRAPATYRIEDFTAEQLRGFVHTAGWDAEWVEAVISRRKGQTDYPHEERRDERGTLKKKYQENA